MNVDRPINAISLFSGGAGLDLGIGAVLPTRTVCYVERESYACAVLVARMEEGLLDPAPIWTNVSTFDGRPWKGVVDLVAGGFPCQDISNAGKRAGIEGERSGLWSEFARIIREVGPRFVVVENVAALLVRGLDRVLGDLAGLGFDAEWGVVRASDVGAPHERRRLFVVAHARRFCFDGLQSIAFGGGSCSTAPWRHGEELADAGGDRRRQGGGNRCHGNGDPTLCSLAARWPTPTAADAKASGAFGYGGQNFMTLTDAAVRTGRRDRNLKTGAPTSTAGRVLNPRFVEALMGWPIGWTDLGSWETESSPNKPPSPSENS